MELSRNEKILENILGKQNDLDDPQSRIENLLIQILEKGFGSKITVEGETLAVK